MWRFLFQACGNIKIPHGVQELDYVLEAYHMLEVSINSLLLSSYASVNGCCRQAGGIGQSQEIGRI